MASSKASKKPKARPTAAKARAKAGPRAAAPKKMVAKAKKAAAAPKQVAVKKAGKAPVAAKAAPVAKIVKGAKAAIAAVAKVVAAPAVVTGRRGRGAAKANFSDVTAAVAAAKSAKQRGGAAPMPVPSLENICREVACEGLATTGGYCRLHYIKNWKMIQRKAVILKEGKLTRYIDELVGKYPDKYLEAIRQDLANDKDFAKVIYDLELDEGVEDVIEGGDQENVEGVIETIRTGGGARDFEDEGDAF